MRRSAVIALAAALGGLMVANAAPPPACHVGAYRLADGSVVDIAPSEGPTLRWRRFDGTTGALGEQPDGHWKSTRGWTGQPDGKVVTFGPCESGAILFGEEAGRLMRFDVTETRFAAGDVELAGRLVLPAGRGRVPVVVLLHGAEHDSALDSYALQRLLPAHGVGAFVFDKRGTGKSGGRYTQDFERLAEDAAVALREARHLAGPRAGRVGYQAGSQGGWVAPLAAARARSDFVIVSFGLAVSVIDEDQQQVALEMRLAGHGPEEIAKALQVADAAERVFESGFTAGFERFDAMRAKYRDEPWYKDLHGNYTHFILGLSADEIRDQGRAYIFGTPFRYDPMPALRSLSTPQLWILGEDDLEAPSAETCRRLQALIADRRPVTLAVYPGAEHGMTEYERGPDGARLSTRYPEGYFAMIRDFAHDGRLKTAYGRSAIADRSRRPLVCPAP